MLRNFFSVKAKQRRKIKRDAIMTLPSRHSAPIRAQQLYAELVAKLLALRKHELGRHKHPRVFCAIYRLLGQRVKYVKYPNTQWLEQRIDQDYKELEQIRQQIHEIYYPPEQKR